jgi:predicted P-loop ATPase
MLASAGGRNVVNNVVLVLIGEQGTYKSTFFAQLLPPKLRQYFHVKTDNTVLNKDDRLQLARNLLICLEEIDVLSKKELNQLKAMVTLPSINDRPAYARNFVNLPHIASLCGTGNNETFLSDPTGSRRWLPFLVESIDDPRSYEINYESLYGQGMYLLADKFRYWFTQEEIKRQNSRNKAFEADCLEEQLIMKYYRIPTLAETGVLVTAGDILEKINKGIKKPLSSTAVGTIMRKIGFSWKIVHGYRKYRVIDLKDSDIQELMKNEAIETDDRAF